MGQINDLIREIFDKEFHLFIPADFRSFPSPYGFPLPEGRVGWEKMKHPIYWTPRNILSTCFMVDNCGLHLGTTCVGFLVVLILFETKTVADSNHFISMQ